MTPSGHVRISDVVGLAGRSFATGLVVGRVKMMLHEAKMNCRLRQFAPSGIVFFVEMWRQVAGSKTLWTHTGAVRAFSADSLSYIFATYGLRGMNRILLPSIVYN